MNNKGTDQPTHPRSLTSAFLFAAWIVTRFTAQSYIARLAHTLYLQPDSLRKASYKPLLVSINLFWSIKNSNEVLNKFKSTGFKTSKMST